VGVSCDNYEGVLAKLKLSTLYSWLRHLDALLITNAFKNKISCSSIPNSVRIRIPTRIIRGYSKLMVSRNFEVSASARCISAANATCKGNDIFKKLYFAYGHFIKLRVIKYNFNFSLFIFCGFILYIWTLFFFLCVLPFDLSRNLSISLYDFIF
jgi:hypothetical protein